MLRFERAMTAGLTARGREVEVLRPEPRFVRLTSHYRYGGLPKYLGYLDKFVLFPRILRARLRRAEPGTVCHILDHGNAVYAPHASAVPVLSNCHDLLQIRSALGEFPNNPVSPSGCRYQRWILRNIASLKKVVCISEKTRSDLLRLTSLPPSSAQVVYMSLNYDFHPVAPEIARPLVDVALTREKLVWPDHVGKRPPFLIAISGAQWYKNRTGLLRIFAELQRFPGAPSVLVYVGPPFDADQQELIKAHGLASRIVHLHRLGDEELRAAYSLATALVFPSWEEGFGWPIAEAQACGCPVFTSGRAPMNEVGGDAAHYFNPADPAEAAGVIARGLALPEPLRRAGLERARLWDPRRMIDAYSEIYDSMLPGPPTTARMP